MQLMLENPNLDAYLAVSEVIDFDDTSIQEITRHLRQSATSEREVAQTLYNFVRDRIPHSFDIDGHQVTCNAAEVLQHREGICFAKAHLLAALLRCAEIPAGFCYQRLVFQDSYPQYLTLHGLNAVYLKSLNQWIRVDARGNKPGIRAEFNVEREVLAFPVRPALQEQDYPTI
ncbi:MAG TPA: transglutaminase family protein, partial [Candidatus Caenarcaniphilales bacterium]